ncbi:bacterio-opsin activator domain-containing protein [Halobaculum limi]|uniref:bacterio-opsin activator domain-containing protein n=1 Tax=Halobaculum limi TaxID=3031916 RepID=UPI002406A6C0|nr:bacterio-opsin activator domain-containing protein [Halobaculum sp. YSMS11]
MTERSGSRVTEEAVLAVFELLPPGEPYTSSEIADELGCARTTAYKRLQDLAASGQLSTKKVGARGRVWWLPIAVPSDGGGAAEESQASVPDYATLLARELQYHAVFNEAFDAIVIADDEAQYVDVNPAACALFGLPREELLGKTIEDFAPEEYDFENAWRDFQGDQLDRGLFPLVRADGERRIVEFAASPNILPGRHLSVLRDVTERSEAKAELERERERSQRYQKSLAADAVIELSFELTGGDVFSDLSATLDCRFEFEGLVPTSDGRLLQYVTAFDVDPDTLTAVLHESPQVNGCRVVHDSAHATELELDLTDSPVEVLFEAGASSRSMHSEGGVTTLVAEARADLALQPLLEAFTDAYPDATVVTKRTLSRPIVTTRQYRDALANTFTERQRETLRAAYLSGYFEWPRTSKANVIAESMGIAASTWLRHLRIAERKLVQWYFDELEA